MSSITPKFVLSSSIEIENCLIEIKNSFLKNAFLMFGQSYIWLAIDKNGELFLLDKEPIFNNSSSGWGCNDTSSYNAIYVDDFNLIDVDWTKTATKILKEDLILDCEFKNKSDFEKDICFNFEVINTEFKDGKVSYEVESDDGEKQEILSRPLIFVSREKAMLITGLKNETLRNEELENEMHEKLDFGLYIKGICPFDGFSSCPQKYWK